MRVTKSLEMNIAHILKLANVEYHVHIFYEYVTQQHIENAGFMLKEKIS